MNRKRFWMLYGIVVAIIFVGGLISHFSHGQPPHKLVSDNAFTIGDRYTTEMANGPIRSATPGAWPDQHRLGAKPEAPTSGSGPHE